ncbi:MAG: helix-turn-helix domain-containing protein [Anaeromyxobacteraceae bacterium]
MLGVDRLLTVREVAARLNVCRATVYSMVERGELPHVRVGNAVRFDPMSLARALEAHRRV